MIDTIIESWVNYSIFGFLCVLDGVRTVEDSEEKDEFEFYYVKDDQRVLLNPANGVFLQDLFNT